MPVAAHATSQAPPPPPPTRSARSPTAQQPSPPNTTSSTRRRRAASAAPASYLRVDTHHATSPLRFLVNQFRDSCSTVLIAVAHVRPAHLDDDDDGERDRALRAVVVALRQAVAHANAVAQYLTSFASVSDATLNGLRAQARVAVDALLAVSAAPEEEVLSDAETQGAGLIAFVRHFGDLARRVYDMVDCYTVLGRVATPNELAAADRTLSSNQVPATTKPESVPRELSTAIRSQRPDASQDAALRRRASPPRSPVPPTPTSKRTMPHDPAPTAAAVARLTDLSRAAALVAEQAAAAAAAMSAPDPVPKPRPRPRSPARNPYADRPLLDASRKVWRHEWTETRVDVTGRTQPACGLCSGSFKFIERRVLCRACRLTVHAACFDGGHPEWIECGVYGPGEGGGGEGARMPFPKWNACCPADEEGKDGEEIPMPMPAARGGGRRPSPPRSWEPMVKIGSSETLVPPAVGADAWRTAPIAAHRGRSGSRASSRRDIRPLSASSRGRTVPSEICGREYDNGTVHRESPPPPMLPSLESLLDNGKAWISLDSPSLYAALRVTSSESQPQLPQPRSASGGGAGSRRLGQQRGDAAGGH